MIKFPARQKIRRAMIILSFVLLPATFVYISCPVIIRGASQGVATGGLIVFVLLFISSLRLGRLWCGWLCPGGGLQEIYILLNDKNVRTGRMNLLKYPIFLFILFIPLISAIRSAGGLKTIDLFYYTDQGISIAQQGSYTIFFVQIAFFTAFALLAGKRAFCHYFCPIAVILITGRKIRDLFRWPALQLSSDAGRCSNCRRCSATCPMSLDVNLMVRQRIMENSECILCGCCVDVCSENAISYSFGR